MICPYLTVRETTTSKDGITVTKEKFAECQKDNCPFYSWKDWNKVGQGCQKAKLEIERERRSLL